MGTNFFKMLKGDRLYHGIARYFLIEKRKTCHHGRICCDCARPLGVFEALWEWRQSSLSLVSFNQAYCCAVCVSFFGVYASTKSSDTLSCQWKRYGAFLVRKLRSIGTTPSTVFQGFVASHLGLVIHESEA